MLIICINNSSNRFIIIINIYFNFIIICSCEISESVLAEFKDSKFCFNPSFQILKTVLILLLKSVGFEWDVIYSSERSLV